MCIGAMKMVAVCYSKGSMTSPNMLMSRNNSFVGLDSIIKTHNSFVGHDSIKTLKSNLSPFHSMRARYHVKKSVALKSRGVRERPF